MGRTGFRAEPLLLKKDFTLKDMVQGVPYVPPVLRNRDLLQILR